MTTATITAPHDALALLDRLTELLLGWSYEGTLRQEQIVQRVAAAYGLKAEVTMLADSAVLTVDERTVSFARAPTVPPLDQMADLKPLLQAIEDGRIGAGDALARLEAVHARPPRWSRGWQVVGLGLFSTGFGISVQATGQEVLASAVLGLLVGVIAVAAQTRPQPRSRPRSFYVLTPGSHGLRGFESWFDGHPIQGFQGLGDMVALFTALAVGMLVAAAVVRR